MAAFVLSPGHDVYTITCDIACTLYEAISLFKERGCQYATTTLNTFDLRHKCTKRPCCLGRKHHLQCGHHRVLLPDELLCRIVSLDKIIAQTPTSRGRPLVIDGITRNDFMRLISAMVTRKQRKEYKCPELASSGLDGLLEWESVFDLAIKLEVPSVFNRIVKNLDTILKTQEPVFSVKLGRRFGNTKWMKTGLDKLAKADRPLTVTEVQLLEPVDIAVIGELREVYCSYLTNRVQDLQAMEPEVVSGDVSSPRRVTRSTLAVHSRQEYGFEADIRNLLENCPVVENPDLEFDIADDANADFDDQQRDPDYAH